MKTTENSIEDKKLNNLPKEEGMTIPKDFFVQFTSQLEARIDQYEKEKTITLGANDECMKRMNHISFNKYRLGNWGTRFAVVAAVACLLVVSIVWFNFFITDSNSSPNVIATMDNNEQTFTEEWMLASVSDYDIMEVVYYGTE